jgi:ribonucleotide reductase beta subunit family protein with ferritin-like domain
MQKIDGMKKTEGYVVLYPWALEAAEKQQDIAWTPKEIDVSKDIQDIRVNMPAPASFAVTYLLKLFTLYEKLASTSYWGRRVIDEYQAPACIERMAMTFAFIEDAVHAPFYNNLNAALNLDTEDFYNEYKQDTVLSARMKFIGQMIDHPDPVVSHAVFSIVEGAILYSSFAFLLHFQSAGKNLLKNVCAGVKFSVRDENLHSEAGALLTKTRVLANQQGRYTLEQRKAILDAVNTIQAHEHAIIERMLPNDDVEGITVASLKAFVNHRINLCLDQLEVGKVGLDLPRFDESNNPIKDWFYDGINAVQLHDFFVGVGNEYNRDWNEKKFIW